MIDVEGTTNFRDAGGWPTTDGQRMRTGLLYRSGDPIRLTDRGRATVDALGLVRAIDVRQHAQHIRSAGFLPPDRTIHIPLVDQVIDRDNPPPLTDASDITELYAGMIEASGPRLRDAVEAIARFTAAGPVLVHCAFGKDRTGIIVALVHAALGVPADAIVADYARSDAPARARRQLLIDQPRDGDPPFATLPEALFTAPAAAMEQLLARAIDDHGSLDAWVAELIGDDVVAALRTHLLEPTPLEPTPLESTPLESTPLEPTEEHP